MNCLGEVKWHRCWYAQRNARHLLDTKQINSTDMLQPLLVKNDKKAKIFIWIFSVVVFAAVAFLAKFKLNIDLGFNVHVFAEMNAIINSIVAVLLVTALIAVKKKNYALHKKIMLTAIVLSVVFLVSYICHHLLAGDTKFGDINHDGVLSDEEKSAAGTLRLMYYIILITHIPLAAIILPFILFTAYRALIGEYDKHKRLVRITWPVWFYVAVSGLAVYLMISPYYT
jgi:putative membrane protein